MASVFPYTTSRPVKLGTKSISFFLCPIVTPPHFHLPLNVLAGTGRLPFYSYLPCIHKRFDLAR
ncbi:hypothetical protein E2C01_086239 [Portunus trituberculatus]|uniref:Uncharacterized protein n=1 Tax=Portunus trituberculatus TaxID=210409 RepID=A0A5B7JE21_PORTR|nr:hypothetical protein [Portunus trituberculatus]